MLKEAMLKMLEDMRSEAKGIHAEGLRSKYAPKPELGEETEGDPGGASVRIEAEGIEPEKLIEILSALEKDEPEEEGMPS